MILGQLVNKVALVLTDCRATQVLQVSQVRRAILALLVLMVSKVTLELRVQEASKVILGLLEKMDLREILEQLDHKAILVL